jgi:hypothetical protein
VRIGQVADRRSTVLWAGALALALALLCVATPAAAEETVFEDDFDDGVMDPTKWTSYQGASEDESCGAVSEPFSLYFTTEGEWSATTRNLDLDDGAEIGFHLRMPDHTVGNSRCDELEDANDVVLQYSTDDGGTWHELGRWNDRNAGWIEVNVTLPASEGEGSTQLRWIQPVHGGIHGPTVDNWAIDDVRVVSSGPARDLHAEGAAASRSSPAIETPSTCELEPCRNQTVLADGLEASTPGVDLSEDRQIPGACTAIVCIGPVTVGPGGPEIESQTVTTDPLAVDPVCETAGSACLGPVTVVEEGLVETPRVALSLTVTNLTLTSNVGETGSVGERTVTIPGTPATEPFNVTVCPETSDVCQRPLAPAADVGFNVVVTLEVGDERFTVSQTIQEDA